MVECSKCGCTRHTGCIGPSMRSKARLRVENAIKAGFPTMPLAGGGAVEATPAAAPTDAVFHCDDCLADTAVENRRQIRTAAATSKVATAKAAKLTARSSGDSHMSESGAVTSASDRDSDEDLVCQVCEGQADGRGMLACETCGGWFHDHCVEVEEDYVEGDKWYCSSECCPSS